MNREAEAHFSNIPDIELNRSKFRQQSSHKTTFNNGQLIPIYVDSDIMPGDTVKIDMGAVIRMTTPIFPIMDNLNADFYWFFVPHRLVWEHFREFWGENRLTAWEQEIEYEIPQIKAPTGGWTKGTIADHFGLPTKIENIEVSHLPFRAYVQCINDWFRDQNLKDACMMNNDETTLTGTNSGDYVINTQLGAEPYHIAKYHDYFTSCLPDMQKGEAIVLPIGGTAPVIGNGIALGITEGTNYSGLYGGNQREIASYPTLYGTQVGTTYSGSGTIIQPTKSLGITTDPEKSGLIADLSVITNGFDISALRTAFQLQKFYERLAMGGSRYIEIVKTLFGVTSPDARQQRSEYLGGTRHPINIDQVIQTSSTDSVSPQGNTAAFSCTTMAEEMFTHSFTEHGTLLGLVAIRTEKTYQQGIERMWSRKKREEFYNPIFANLSNQAVLNKEIYATGTSADDEAFGYQEAWAELRYGRTNKVTGAFRSNYEGSLDSWHFADNYTSQPYLSSDWIDEDKANVDRTLAVTSELEDQFLADFFFEATYVRPMPVFSIPGLIDHH